MKWNYGDLVNLSEAGERLGLSNLADYKKKHATFPQPTRLRPALYLWGEIRDWYAENVKPRARKEAS